MELETHRSFDQPSRSAGAETPMAPIPLVDVDEEFELERPYESPTTSIGTKEAPAARPAAAPPAPAPPAPAPPAAAPAPPAAPEVEDEFELEAPHEAPSTAWAATIRPLPVLEEPPPPKPAPPRPAAPPAPPPPPASTAPSALISPTLGELYFNQGFTEKAIEVYRELSAREPSNERLGARLRELEKMQDALSSGGSAPSDAPAASSPDATAADRREAIERTIARLEGLLSAIRKG